MDGVIAERYRVGERLGRGGMGTVWRAYDELLERHVAVKELHLDEGLSDDEARTLRERTLREARTVAQVGHPNILVLHDVVEQDERPWIVMELVEGRSLAERVAAEGPVGPAEAARIGLALLEALTTAHRVGILHRDIKPANVLLESGTGRVVLTDFGIARVAGLTTISETGSLFGSPEYMAPERLANAHSGPASDLWSLGVLLCAAVEGETPFHRASVTNVLHAVALDAIHLPDSLGPLAPVVRGLLERDPERRTDAEAAGALLRAFVRGEDEEGPKAPPAAPGHGSPASSMRSASPERPAPVPVAAPPSPDPAPVSAPSPDPVPSPASPAPPPAPSPPSTPGSSPVRRGGKRAVLVAAVLVAALAAGGITAGFVLSGRDGGSGGSGGNGAAREGDAAHRGRGEASASPSGPEVPVGSAPSGYRMVDDSLGFRMAVPKGFTRSLEPPRVFYYSPGRKYRIGVLIQDQERGGALGAMRASHEGGPDNYPGYRNAAVTSRAKDGFPGARWEFTWSGAASDDGPRHTFDQSWDQAGKMYDVWVSSPVPEVSTGKGYFDTALSSFVRTRPR